MSGLFGCVTQPGEAAGALAAAERMSRALRLNALEETSVTAVSPSTALGRQHIGLLNRDPQPRTSPPHGLHLWLTGEFYGDEARPQSVDDEEFALRVASRDGARGLAALAGMFLAAVWDAGRNTLTLVNDRHGLYPHYYAQPGNTLLFAPRMRAILDTGLVPRRIDASAIAEYARYQQLFGDKTWIEEIRLLPPASILTFEAATGRMHIERYWDWDRIALRRSVPLSVAAEETASRLESAIHRRLQGDLRTGIFLSGGLDSRALLGVAVRRRSLATVTFGAPGCRDVVLAARVARRAGVTNHWFPFVDGRWVLGCAPLHLALTEGMHSWIHAHGLITLPDVRRLFDANLSGWAGGTRLSWVPERDLLLALASAMPSERAVIVHQAFSQRFAWPGLTDEEASPLLRSHDGIPLAPLASESLAREFATAAHYAPERQLVWFFAREHDRRSTLNLVVFQRAAIEVRCPFVDEDFVGFVESLPDEVRLSPMFQRGVVTRLVPRLARIPYDKDWLLPHASPWVREPHRFLRRGLGWLRRRGLRVGHVHPTLYADYENYLRHELRPWAEHLLFHERTLSRGFYDVEALRALWARHVSGRELHTIGKIVPVMAIEMALRYLVDGDTPEQACGLDEASRARFGQVPTDEPR